MFNFIHTTYDNVRNIVLKYGRDAVEIAGTIKIFMDDPEIESLATAGNTAVAGAYEAIKFVLDSLFPDYINDSAKNLAEQIDERLKVLRAGGMSPIMKDMFLFKMTALIVQHLSKSSGGPALSDSDSDTIAQIAYKMKKENMPVTSQSGIDIHMNNLRNPIILTDATPNPDLLKAHTPSNFKGQ